MEKLLRNDVHNVLTSGVTGGRRVKGNDCMGQRVCSSHRRERSTMEQPRGSSSYESNRLAKALGISSCPQDGHLWWIVQEAVSAELPEGWSRIRASNRVRYQNSITGEITAQHPLQSLYKVVAAAERAKSDAAVEKYAKDLGLDLVSERDLMWIALEAGTTPLPFNWRAETLCDDGRTCYRNTLTGRTQMDHPFYRHYRTIVLEERFQKQLEAKKNRETNRNLAWPSHLSRLPMDAGDTYAHASNEYCIGEHSADRASADDEAANDFQHSPIAKSQAERYSEDELSELAPVLGLHPTEDKDLLWLVSDFLDEPLPAAWEECVDNTGCIYFYNHATREFNEDHPLYEKYLEKAREAKSTKRSGRSHEGVPQGKSFDKELARFASNLNLDPLQDRDLVWIAKEAMKAPMPDGWCRRTINETGEIYYFNYITGENLWVHPNVQRYTNTAHVAKQDRQCDILDYATSLGIDEASEGNLVGIVAQLLAEKLPSDWESGVSECGYPFYFNAVTNECFWDHPMKNQHAIRVEQERRKQNRCPASSGAHNRCNRRRADLLPVNDTDYSSALAASGYKAAGSITWTHMEQLERACSGPAADGCESESEPKAHTEEQALSAEDAHRSDKATVTTSPASAMLAEDANPAELTTAKDGSCQRQSGSASATCCSKTSKPSSGGGAAAVLELTSRAPSADRSQGSSDRPLASRRARYAVSTTCAVSGSRGCGQTPSETPRPAAEHNLTACSEKSPLVLELSRRDRGSCGCGKPGETKAGGHDAGDVTEAAGRSGASVGGVESQGQERHEATSRRTVGGGQGDDFKERSHASSNGEQSSGFTLAPERRQRPGQAAQGAHVRKSAPPKGPHSRTASTVCCRQWFKKRRHCKDCANAKRT